jgi:hypothetical protein
MSKGAGNHNTPAKVIMGSHDDAELNAIFRDAEKVGDIKLSAFSRQQSGTAFR